MLYVRRHLKILGAALAALACVGVGMASCSVEDGKLKIKLTPEEAKHVEGINIDVEPPPTRGPAPIPPLPRWSTKDGKILRNGEPFQVRGISWFGFETNDHQLHGLWTGGSSVEGFLDQIKVLGFNALRVPISPEVLQYNTMSNPNWGTRGRARANLINLVNYAQNRDIAVLIDLHNTASYRGLIGKLDPPRYGQEQWLGSLKELAEWGLAHPNLMGIDLLNEPWDYTWQEWVTLAEEAGNAIHAINRDLLIFVEGVANKGVNTSTPYFWGENLSEAGDWPVKLNLANRLVYSPHVYGPSVAHQSYFDAPNFPDNMDWIWQAHWGYLATRCLEVPMLVCAARPPVVTGEWGGRYVGKDRQWAEQLVRYMGAAGFDNFYWALNPNSGDTGGILKDDWRTVDEEKMKLVRRSWGWK